MCTVQDLIARGSHLALHARAPRSPPCRRASAASTPRRGDGRLGVLLLAHDVQVRGEAAQVVNADANLRLWLGSSEKKDDTSFAAPIPNRNTHSLPTEKTSLATFFDGLGPDKTITPANEEVVGAMLKTGVEGWFAPGFDSNELERHTGGNPLVALGLALYDRHGWAGDSLGIPFNTMHSFLQKVQAAYNPVAYHNAKHSVICSMQAKMRISKCFHSGGRALWY